MIILQYTQVCSDEDVINHLMAVVRRNSNHYHWLYRINKDRLEELVFPECEKTYTRYVLDYVKDVKTQNQYISRCIRFFAESMPLKRATRISQFIRDLLKRRPMETSLAVPAKTVEQAEAKYLALKNRLDVSGLRVLLHYNERQKKLISVSLRPVIPTDLSKMALKYI
jgi:hypothetical protein